MVDIVRTEKGDISRNKFQACYFCGKEDKTLARHLQRRHNAEPLVVSMLAAQDKTSRAMRLTYLRNLGNFKHNCNVIQENNGYLIVAKRSKDRKPEDYVPCLYCFAMYVESEIWRHSKTCPFRSPVVDGDLPTDRDVVESGKLLLFGAVDNVDPQVAIQGELKMYVLDHMRIGPILEVVKKDALIVRFGSAMLKKSGPSKYKLISQRMRQMARLTLEVTKDESLCTLKLTDLLAPQYFDDILTAVKSICQSGVSKQGHRILAKPSLAIQIGNSLVKCCQLKKGVGIRSNNKSMTEDAEQFLVLHKAEWTDEVSSTALASMMVKKNYTVAELPSTSDLVKLKDYCHSRMLVLTDMLQERTCDYSIWRELAEVVMARLVVFNKRRGSELAKLHVSDFLQRPDWTSAANLELLDTLQPLEKKLMNRSVKFYVMMCMHE